MALMENLKHKKPDFVNILNLPSSILTIIIGSETINEELTRFLKTVKKPFFLIRMSRSILMPIIIYDEMLS